MFPVPPCPIKMLLHIDCPLCGGTRMVEAVVHGDLPLAFRMNAVALVLVVAAVWAVVAVVVERVADRRMPSWHRLRWAWPIVCAVVAAWFVIRNIPVEPFTALRV